MASSSIPPIRRIGQQTGIKITLIPVTTAIGKIERLALPSVQLPLSVFTERGLGGEVNSSTDWFPL